MLWIDIATQCSRCFFVPQSYAVTAPEQTLAQIIVMAVHVDMAMIMFFMNNEVGAMTTNWVADLSYLSVRLSLSGNLAMRSVGFYDFLTLAVPFGFCIGELNQVMAYILSGSQTAAIDDDKVEKHSFRRGMIALVWSLVATVAAAVGASIVIQNDLVFSEQCTVRLNDDIMGEATDIANSEGDILPHGSKCYYWQYNLFLDPPCTCQYLDVTVDSTFQYLGFSEDPKHTAWQPVLAHVENVQFLNLWINGPIIPEDWQLISTWTELRMLFVETGTAYRESDVDTLPFKQEFSKLPNIIFFSYRDLIPDSLQDMNFEQIDVAFLESWPKLESFLCAPCPFVSSPDVFAQAHLPMLKSLELYGVSSCESDHEASTEAVDFACVGYNDTETCTGIPQWFFQKSVDFVRSSTHSDCFRPVCDQYLETFDAMLPPSTNLQILPVDVFPFWQGLGWNAAAEEANMCINFYRILLTFQNLTFLFVFLFCSASVTVKCVCRYFKFLIFYNFFVSGFLEEIRAVSPFYQDFYNNSDVFRGRTQSEHIALKSGYGTCSQCAQSKAIDAAREGKTVNCSMYKIT